MRSSEHWDGVWIIGTDFDMYMGRVDNVNMGSI